MKSILAALVLYSVSLTAQAKPYLNDMIGSEAAAVCAVQVGWAYSARSAAEQGIPLETVFDDINSKFPQQMNRQVYNWYQLALAAAKGAYPLDQYTPPQIYYGIMQACTSAVGLELSHAQIDEIRGEGFTPYVPFE